MVQAQHGKHRDDSESNELARAVRQRVRLPVNVSPEDAVRAVMCTLALHPSAGEARAVFDAFPRLIRPLLVRCSRHLQTPQSSFSRDELIHRVGDHLQASRGDAEDITSAVVIAVSARLPGGKPSDVAARLPRDLQSLWSARRVALPADPHPIVLRIEQEVEALPTGVDGTAAFATVMGTLTRRLTLGEARHLARCLPIDLRPLVEDYLDDRDEESARLDREELLELVAQALDTDDVDEAEEVTRAVFVAVQDYLRNEVYEHIMRQLPLDLQELWAV